MCMEAKDCNLRATVDALDQRVTNLETSVSQMRTECQSSFAALSQSLTSTNAAVANLATEFGTRMNTIDTKLVEEKVKWGDCVRSIVKWTVRALLGIALYAAGINITKSLIQAIWGG